MTVRFGPGALQGEVAELVDGAALEKLYWGNLVVGSNPTLSAFVRRSCKA